ncbi:hypothetical protein [uncultured Legionella sp.]|uniref:hypothetical protein n=1 Tax=uncultured Legionella sp. TaxID=210934 RepID=UPI00262799F7|nr:hypothetical protein [uncultured Legionella sp.]
MRMLVVDDIDDGSNRTHNEDSVKLPNEELLPEDREFKDVVLQKLIDIRDKEIQPQLYNKERPEREPHIQRANFIYALIFKVREDFKAPKDVLEFVRSLEKQYPLAVPTVNEVKGMLNSLPRHL